MVRSVRRRETRLWALRMCDLRRGAWLCSNGGCANGVLDWPRKSSLPACRAAMKCKYLVGGAAGVGEI